MPPRLNKRQQRAQDELSHLTGPPAEAASDDEAPGPALGFAALASQIDSEDYEESDADETLPKAGKKKNKKKKKKKEAKPLVSGGAQSMDTPDPGKVVTQSRASKKKGKGKENGPGAKDEGDDLDKALEELSLKYPELKQSVRANAGLSASGRARNEQNTLLAVSLAHLDSEAEMRKFFGAKVISASKAQTKSPRGAKAAIQGLKSNLTKPQPTWWSASQREGLSTRILSHDETSEKEKRVGKLGEDRWWTVEYSNKYRSVTKAFVSAVMSGDPEQFWKILSKLPWHADTLLQMSEVYRHREEHSQSVDFLNRALFTYERSFIGAFSFTTGTNRLDFDRVENRPFYLALSRMIADLQRRGCSRTSFEFARLLLSLDPYSDPHGAYLYLDYLAVKSGMHDWLLSMWDLHDTMAGLEISYRVFNVTVLPGWSYARALALRARESSRKEGHDESTKALREAIWAFPSVVPLLADKVDVVLPGELRGHNSFRVHVDRSSLSDFEPLIHLLSHLYVHRSFSLWKLPEHASWFKETAISAFSSFSSKLHPLRERLAHQFTRPEPSGDIQYSLLQSELARSICRHVFVLADANAARRLTAFFPREITNASTLSCDPLPPLSAISLYNSQFFDGSEDIFAFRLRTRRERELDARNLARMIPNAMVRHQLQALYDARPEIQQQFPGGVIEFAQAAVQLGEDFWDNLMNPLMLDEFGAGGGAMPGGLGDPVLDEAGEDDEDNVAELADRAQAVDNAEELRVQHVDTGRNDGSGDEEVDDDEEEGQDVPIFPVRVLRNLVNRFWGGGGAAQEDSDSDERPV